MAYSTLAEGRDDDALEALNVEIGMIDDPADEAREELRKHQEVMGIKFDDPDAPVSADLKSMGDLPDEYLR